MEPLPGELLLTIGDYLDRYSVEHLAACCKNMHSALRVYRVGRRRKELLQHRVGFGACLDQIKNIKYNIQTKAYTTIENLPSGRSASYMAFYNYEKPNPSAYPTLLCVTGMVKGSNEYPGKPISRNVWVRRYFISGYNKVVEVSFLVECEPVG